MESAEHQKLEPAPPPRPPARGRTRRDSGEQRPRPRRQICSWTPPEHREQRREPPSPEASPATPPSPQRRRQATHAHLGYVHGGIRRFPNLPPPERPRRRGIERISAGELGLRESRPKIAFVYCRWGNERCVGAFGWLFLTPFFVKAYHSYIKIVTANLCDSEFCLLKKYK